jgi:hypothetical protein
VLHNYEYLHGNWILQYSLPRLCVKEMTHGAAPYFGSTIPTEQKHLAPTWGLVETVNSFPHKIAAFQEDVIINSQDGHQPVTYKAESVASSMPTGIYICLPGYTSVS